MRSASSGKILIPHGEERVFARLRTMLRIAGRTMRPPNETLTSHARVVPADPRAKTAAHHVFQVGAPQPRQFFGEERDALPVAARHPRDVGAPEHPLRPERIEDAVQSVTDIAE